MLNAPPMKASDYTCLLCGTKLGLNLSEITTGDNTGSCTACAEPFTVKISKTDMMELTEAEE